MGRPSRDVALACGAGLLALAAIVWEPSPLLRGPAPYPPEWRWDLRQGSSSGRAGMALACGAGLIALLAWPPRRTPLAVAAAIPLGLGLCFGLLELEPAGAMRTLVQRTMSRTVTSYYSVALTPAAQDVRQLLDRHDELLLEMRRTGKHASTHPPGPVVFYRGLLELFDRNPGLAAAVLGAAGFEDIERRPAERAAAAAGPLLILLACAATAWPLAALVRRAGGGEAEAARAALLWPLLPGPALMAPQFDQALALPVTAATALAAAAASTAQTGRRWALGLGAGACAAVALFLSYGAVAFLALAGAATLAAVIDGREAWPRAARALVAAAVGASALMAVPMVLGHHPLRSALTALRIHREAYTGPRSYALWLAFNPLDLALFLGVPVAVLLAVRLVEAARTVRCADMAAGDRFSLAALAGLALLALSGTVRGEVGRIWIPVESGTDNPGTLKRL